MSTRSAIAIQTPEGKFKAIYCHWDGYLEHNGAILYQYYRDPEKVNQLIDLGDLSSLAPEIGDKHNFDDCPEGVCNFYGRDRGEDDVECRVFDTVLDVVKYYDWSDYYYFMIDNSWKVIRNTDIHTMVDLREALSDGGLVDLEQV